LKDLQKGENSSYLSKVVSRKGAVYFYAYHDNGAAIYKSDGTKEGLHKMLNPADVYLTDFTANDNGLLFYLAINSNTYSYELWRTDGTPTGTFSLGPNAYFVGTWISTGNTLFYVAGDYTTGFELWKTDGTVAGTMMVKDINPGPGGSYPYSLFAYNNEVYFGAYDGNTNFSYSFWKSDGTAKGTIKLKDITPAWSYGEEEAKRLYAGVNNTVFVSASDYYSNTSSGGELYKTDGTPRGTQLVKDINAAPYAGSFPYNLTEVDGLLYFTADDGNHGYELWFSNGTAQKTMMVRDISPGYESSYIYRFCAAGGKLFFMQWSYTGDNVLWVSDRGNAVDPNQDNTRPVDDPVFNGLTNIANLTASGNNIFLTGYSYKYGFELYVANVTAKPYFITNSSKTSERSAMEVIDETSGLTLFPNPSRGNTTLNLKAQVLPTDIRITNAAGKMVWQQQGARQASVVLPTNRLAAGVYFITVQTAEGAKTIRLVKE
jgi:ELWxxDGT repeat protein